MRNLLRRIGKYNTLLFCLLVVLVLDQSTKYFVVQHIRYGTYINPPPIPVIDGFFYLVHIGNTGVAWGMLQGFGSLLAIFAVIVILSIFLFRRMLQLHLRPMQIVFGIMIGGILGNFIDRILVKHVVDFIDIHLPFYRWPAFNIADSAIFIGVTSYIILSFWYDSKKNKPSKEE